MDSCLYPMFFNDELIGVCQEKHMHKFIGIRKVLMMLLKLFMFFKWYLFWSRPKYPMDNLQISKLSGMTT